MKLRAPPGPSGKQRNIKRSNQPNPICDGRRPHFPQLDRPHPPVKMKPMIRRNDTQLQYWCLKCFRVVEMDEPITKRSNTHR